MSHRARNLSLLRPADGQWAMWFVGFLSAARCFMPFAGLLATPGRHDLTNAAPYWVAHRGLEGVAKVAKATAPRILFSERLGEFRSISERSKAVSEHFGRFSELLRFFRSAAESFGVFVSVRCGLAAVGSTWNPERLRRGAWRNHFIFGGCLDALWHPVLPARLKGYAVRAGLRTQGGAPVST